MQTQGTMEKEICTIDEGELKEVLSVEGYFTIEHYCDLTGIKKNTAYQRAYRGTIKAFNENGKWFFYYNDETDDVPDGFIRYDKYAETVGVHPASIYSAIKRQIFESDNVVHLCDRICNGKRRMHYYIREGTYYPTPKDVIARHNNAVKAKMNASRPVGYLTVAELAKREGCQAQVIFKRLQKNTIPSINIDGHWYVPESTRIIKRQYKKEAAQ